MPLGPREGRILHAMSIDDAYEVQRVLSKGPNGRTEVVTIDETGPYLRKRIPIAQADRKVWAALEECASPRLPHVEATYTTPDEFVVVSNFVPADTLEEVVAAESSLASSEAVRIALEVCEAVDDLHCHGIVHCDIAPRNVLLAADGAHVVDLGNACQVGREFSAKEHPRGTWGFAAPEQYGFAPIDERTDVYAVGRLLGYLLTGVAPDDERYKAVLADEDRVSASLREVVDRASAFEPSSRYQTAADLAEAVKAAVWGDGGGEVPASRNEGPTANARGAGRAKRLRDGRFSDATVPQMIVAVVGVALLVGIGLTAMVFVASMGIDAMTDIAHEKLSQTEAKDAKAPSSSNGNKASDESAEDHQPAVNSLSMTGGEAVGTSANQPSKIDASEALSIAESAWYVRDSTVYWVYGVRNNSDETVPSSTVQIAGRDAEGHVTSSDYQDMRPIRPDQTVYFAGSSSNGEDVASIAFSVQGSDRFGMPSSEGEDPVLRVTDLTKVEDEYWPRFLGEVVLEKGMYRGIGNGVTLVTVVLRNEQGELVGGLVTTTDLPKNGSPQTFDTYGLDVLPEYTTAEAYAYEW